LPDSRLTDAEKPFLDNHRTSRAVHFRVAAAASIGALVATFEEQRAGFGADARLRGGVDKST